MVRGLDHFREHFADHTDQFIIIGGTACDLSLTNAGLEFRATKDIDLVLCLETIDAAFGRVFWSFVNAGAYASLQATPDDRTFYRFTKPQSDAYPVMLELFSRVPDVLGSEIAGHLTPIPIDDAVSSLSAILLDRAYDDWTCAGRIEIDGLPVVRPEHLIPLKARAWLDLTDRLARGSHVDRNDIRKHRNDVFRLFAIADPDYGVAPAPPIRHDMQQFIEQMRSETVNLKAVGLSGFALDDVLDTLLERYDR